ncbi:hypothetical protein C8R45DRAFT_1007906, partial [Mycena sanguinolenta]
CKCAIMAPWTWTTMPLLTFARARTGFRWRARLICAGPSCVHFASPQLLGTNFVRGRSLLTWEPQFCIVLRGFSVSCSRATVLRIMATRLCLRS